MAKARRSVTHLRKEGHSTDTARTQHTVSDAPAERGTQHGHRIQHTVIDALAGSGVRDTERGTNSDAAASVAVLLDHCVGHIRDAARFRMHQG